MHRTNIYLTDEQERALDQRARQAGTTRSAVVRDIIDRDLEAPRAIDPEVAAGFAELADLYDEITEGMFDDDPDVRIER
ncbi:CopG family transcriptional regulator [Iamia sp.]|uniref:ribbon-helix-helix domain-containing protein n=1 Tax=Iamia sp. TaxID=2722710 RepID=UPI002C70833F|nr:CopG family transcriptional regulator [Iamia sp.]HXH59545.1 CopG family transcriptional regulator [Iamia sp.]